MSGIVLSGCQDAAKKEKEAQEDLQEAQEDLNEAKRERATEEEWQQFKDEINAKIDANVKANRRIKRSKEKK
jgi:outer membrane murein-binding lipoprotein Lpp